MENLCREAAILAIRGETDKVSFANFEQAIKKIHPTVSPEVIRRYETFIDYMRRQWLGQSEPVM